jgi:UDP-2,3-diacylglucosamine pyrophosphatase LpxH
MTLRYRSIWISDTHLGTKGCQAEALRDFITHVECDTLYLVGDIIDLWKFRTGLYWPLLHSDVVQRIINKAKQGTRVIYIPGNHDEIFRKHVGIHFNGVEIKLEAIHTAADGKRYLVMHGDGFDTIVCNNRSLAYIGGEAYEYLLVINTGFNRLRKKLGYGYWSLSAFLKNKVKNVVSHINNFQHILALEAKRKKVDGIICGHIHHAEISELEFGISYCNCGDWVESCTALVEDYTGKIRLIHWLQDGYKLLDQADAKPHRKRVEKA